MADDLEPSKDWKAEISKREPAYLSVVLSGFDERHRLEINSSPSALWYPTVKLDDKIIYKVLLPSVNTIGFQIGLTQFKLRFKISFLLRISEFELWADDRPVFRSA